MPVLIDSSTDADFIASGLVKQLGLEAEALPSPAEVHAPDNHTLPPITHLTRPVHIIMSGNHHEHITFHFMDLPRIPVIFIFLWLLKHQPHGHFGVRFRGLSCMFKICISLCVLFSRCQWLSLYPSISSRGLNAITIKIRYPVPLPLNYCREPKCLLS